jgi:predicted MFS family arabinose efflux permease
VPGRFSARRGSPDPIVPPVARASALAVAVGAATVLPGFLVGALSLQIRDGLDASLTQVAAGVTVFFAAGAVGSGPLGRLSQRVGARASMRAAAATSAACLLAIAVLASSLEAFLVLLALAGLANAAAQPAINLFMAEEVPLERQGLAFGVKQSAIPAAVMLSGLALPALALPLGWRPTVAVCAGLALAVAFTAGRGGRARAVPREQRGGAGPRPARSLVLLAVGAALASFGPSALGAYLVATAVDAGVAEASAGLLLAFGSAASLLVRVGLGERADRRADYGFGAVVALLAGGAAGFALLAGGSAAAIVAGSLVAFSLGWGWPGLFNLAVVERHREAPAAATGVTQSGIYLGAAGGPVTFGLLSAEIGYASAWAVIASVVVLAAAVIGVAQSRFGSAEPGTRGSGAEAGIRHT